MLVICGSIVLPALANTILVPPKARSGKGQVNKENKPKPISGLDVDALLQNDTRRRARINPQNAIPEFKQAVQNAEDVKGWEVRMRSFSDP